MRLKSWHVTVLVALAVIGGAIALREWDPAPIRVMRLKTFDVFQRIEPRPLSKMPVAVVDLDDASLAKHGQWPWPRTLLADMVDRLAEAGAVVIGFDVVWPEADRTSPENIVELYRGLDDATRGKLLSMPSNDEAFAAALARTRTVLGQSTTQTRSPFNEGRPPALRATYGLKSTVRVEATDSPLHFLLLNPGITRNIQVLEDAAGGLGVFNIDADTDQIVRNVPLIFRGEGDLIYPTLSIEMLRVATGQKTAGVKWHPRVGIVSIFFKGLEIPTDEAGRVWPHFSKWGFERQASFYISAMDVLDGSVGPDRLKGRFVIVGTSAVGLLDIKATPLDNFVPGVDLHAQVLESMLEFAYQHAAKQQGQIDEAPSPFLSRPNFAEGVEETAIGAGGVLLTVAVPVIGAVWSLAVALALIAAMIGSSWYLFTEFHYLIDMVYPAVSVFVLYTVLTYLKYTSEQAQKRQVRTAFAQYLSPALVEQLADHPEQLQLGGERKGMTIMFSDIRGFTSIAETFKTDPEGLVRLINRYLTPMTDLIMSKGGTIDKYMGDAIMAFWNAPIADAGHARHACEAALAMQAKTRELNATLESEAAAAGRAFAPINIGVGVNSGEVFVGNMGSDQRFDYSVLGDDVNLASRLEGQSKTYAVGIVIGENTQTRADDYAHLELDLIRVKGKAEAVRIFTLLGDTSVQRSPEFTELARRHGEMLAAYRQQDWLTARAMVADCRGLNGGLDGLYDLYDERIAIYQRDPPGPGWDGVFVATTK
ncbi:MAG: adenylate/guanylate cyclase domain-containing protein [Alphaproteobacteria bacterium]